MGITVVESYLFPTRRDGQIGSLILGSGGGGSSMSNSGVGGTGADNQVAVFTGTNSLEGTTGLIYDGSDLDTIGNIKATADVFAYSLGAASGYSTPNTFKTWHLATDSGYTWGSTDVVAVGDSDIMDLVAGTGIVITTDPTSKAIKITSSGGYLTTETDPTVYAWAKAATKPSYTYSEVGALASGGTAVDSDKLDGQHGSYYAPIASPVFTGIPCVSASLGDKLILYNGYNYGLGVQVNLLQIFVPTSSDRVGIGYGNSAGFTETLSVKGGKVGISTAAPSEKLHVVGNIVATTDVIAYYA